MRVCPARLRGVDCVSKLLLLLLLLAFSAHHFYIQKGVWILLKRSLLQLLSVLAAFGITFFPGVLQRDSIWDLSPCQECVWETEFTLFHFECDTGFCIIAMPRRVDSPQSPIGDGLLAPASLETCSLCLPNLAALFCWSVSCCCCGSSFLCPGKMGPRCFASWYLFPQAVEGALRYVRVSTTDRMAASIPSHVPTCYSSAA